jgi:hypothetical protein
MSGAMKEYIVYVKHVNGKRIQAGKMLTSSFIAGCHPADGNGNWKLVYFEFKASKRSAEAGENKLRSLNKKSLMDYVKKSNPEMLDLKFTINSNKITEELIY